MTRRQPTITAVRDQIVATLHAAYPLALTTRELAERLPPVVARVECDCRETLCDRPIVWIGESRLLECHKTWHVYRRPRRSADIHRHLVALARKGDVIRIGHNRQASQAEPWTVEPNATSMKEIADLERAWAGG